MKDIIIDIDKIKYPYSGLGKFCSHLTESLLELNSGEFDFGFYHSVPCIYPKQSYRAHRLYGSIPCLLPKSKVWHSIHQDAMHIPKKQKLILTIHDMNSMYENKSKSFKKRFLDRLFKMIQRSDHVAFISQFAKQSTLNYFDIPEKKMSVIYNGVTKLDKITRPNLSIPKKFFLSIGHILPKKNFQVLVDMMELRDETLVLVGHYKGKHGDEIMERVREKKMENKVLFVGELVDEEKEWLIEHCTAFLFPSLFEGFGIPVIESMVRGRPTFSSKKTSLPEVCGEHAYYFDSFDPRDMAEVIERGLNDFNEEKSKKMIEWARRYCWKKTAKAYLDIYRKLL
ncbi:MAG: glycosyltransferase family 1 protein [Bacteriovoracales bacterium]|nr:glycosyltransferase family 1 protein [Bacteriovoracales bacterium]